MLSNILLLVISFFLVWIPANLVILKYDQVDGRSAIVVVEDERLVDPNVIPFIVPHVFFNGKIMKSVDEYKKKGVLSTDFELLPDRMTFPLGSAPNTRMVFCQEDYGWNITALDRYGFSNKDSVWDSPVDLVLVGDSFAQGACTDGNVQSQLVQKGVNAVSLGMGGSGPLTEYAVIMEYLSKFETKAIAWLIVTNDVVSAWQNTAIDFDLELGSRGLRKYMDDASYLQNYFDLKMLEDYRARALEYAEAYVIANQNNVISVRNKLNSEPGVFFDILRGAPILRRVKKKRKNLSVVNSADDGRTWLELKKDRKQKVLELYDRVADLAKGKDIDITFIFLPSATTCLGLYKNDPFAFIKEHFKSRAISYFDFYDDVATNCDAYFSRKKGGHFNNDGYNVLAERINKSMALN